MPRSRRWGAIGLAAPGTDGPQQPPSAAERTIFSSPVPSSTPRPAPPAISNKKVSVRQLYLLEAARFPLCSPASQAPGCRLPSIMLSRRAQPGRFLHCAAGSAGRGLSGCCWRVPHGVISQGCGRGLCLWEEGARSGPIGLGARSPRGSSAPLRFPSRRKRNRGLSLTACCSRASARGGSWEEVSGREARGRVRAWRAQPACACVV